MRAFIPALRQTRVRLEHFPPYLEDWMLDAEEDWTDAEQDLLPVERVVFLA